MPQCFSTRLCILVFSNRKDQILCNQYRTVVKEPYIIIRSVSEACIETESFPCKLVCLLADSAQHGAGVSAPSSGSEGPGPADQDPLQISGNHSRPLPTEGEGKQRCFSSAEVIFEHHLRKPTFIDQTFFLSTSHTCKISSYRIVLLNQTELPTCIYEAQCFHCCPMRLCFLRSAL